MHKEVKARRIRCRGPEGKAIVSAVLERGGRVRAKVIDNWKKKAIQEHIREHVEAGSTIYSEKLNRMKD